MPSKPNEIREAVKQHDAAIVLLGPGSRSTLRSHKAARKACRQANAAAETWLINVEVLRCVMAFLIPLNRR